MPRSHAYSLYGVHLNWRSLRDSPNCQIKINPVIRYKGVGRWDRMGSGMVGGEEWAAKAGYVFY